MLDQSRFLQVLDLICDLIKANKDTVMPLFNFLVVNLNIEILLLEVYLIIFEVVLEYRLILQILFHRTNRNINIIWQTIPFFVLVQQYVYIVLQVFKEVQLGFLLFNFQVFENFFNNDLFFLLLDLFVDLIAYKELV